MAAEAILLVGTDASSRETAGPPLRDAGYRVQEAATAQQALRFLAVDAGPELVIVAAPPLESSRRELVRGLKADPTMAARPLLVISSASGPEAPDLESGSDALLVEPVPPRVLLAQVQTLLEVGRLRRELSQEKARAEIERHQSEAALEELQASNEELLTMGEELRGGQASRVVPFVAAYPLVTVLLSVLALKEHISAPRAAGAACVAIGVLLLRLGG